MKLTIAILLLIAIFSTTAVLFSGVSSKSPANKTTPSSSIDIKWGEGSEAGEPGNTTPK